jgi:hypothetical protein
MTREDIERRVEESIKQYFGVGIVMLPQKMIGELRDTISATACELIKQAYGEAAQIASAGSHYKSGHSANYDAGVVMAATSISKSIRALKDSLAEESAVRAS